MTTTTKKEAKNETKRTKETGSKRDKDENKSELQLQLQLERERELLLELVSIIVCNWNWRITRRMSANIVNVVHKEGRQAGRQEGRQPALQAIHYASFCAACGMQHACAATCHRAAEQQARNCHSWSSSREWRIVQGPQSYSPRYVVRCFSLLLWRHLNELQINFILVACASLRMEMMMDNNDATTGSPSPRPLRRPTASAMSASPRWRRLNSFPVWSVNEKRLRLMLPPPCRGTENPICSNSNWASASLNWFVCLHMHTPTSVCVCLCMCAYTYEPPAYNLFRMAEKALVPPICKWNTIFSYISLRYSRNVTYAESQFVWLAFDELWLPFMESDSRFWPLALS